MTKEEATKLIETYGKAWETKDSDLAVSIFTPDAVYFHSKEPESEGVDEIKSYWEKKVVREQEDIKFNIKNIRVDGDIVYAEWHAIFNDVKRKVLIELQEKATFTVKGGKFSSLKHTYKSRKIPY